MVQLRKNDQTLIYGDWQLVDPENPAVFAYTRTLGAQKRLVVLNFKATPADLQTTLNISNAKVLISNYPDTKPEKHLRPYEAYILELK
jgi:oligo-1,6-glucosidase